MSVRGNDVGRDRRRSDKVVSLDEWWRLVYSQPGEHKVDKDKRERTLTRTTCAPYGFTLTFAVVRSGTRTGCLASREKATSWPRGVSHARLIARLSGNTSNSRVSTLTVSPVQCTALRRRSASSLPYFRCSEANPLSINRLLSHFGKLSRSPRYLVPIAGRTSYLTFRDSIIINLTSVIITTISAITNVTIAINFTTIIVTT